MLRPPRSRPETDRVPAEERRDTDRALTGLSGLSPPLFPEGDMAFRGTFTDPGCSSSEEDSSRADMSEEAGGEERKPPAVRRHHPFSVEALMSGRKTVGRGGEPTCCKTSRSLVAASGLNSVYLCRETRSPPGESRSGFPAAAPPSPVKCEASEPEDCAASWAAANTFPSQPRKLFKSSLINKDSPVS